MKAGNLFKNNPSSELVIVLIMNFLSCEKKKNEPLRPAPSPALKTISLLNLGLRDYLKLTRFSAKYSGNISTN